MVLGAHLVLAALSCVTSAFAQTPDDPARLVDRVRKERELVDPRVFLLLAAPRDENALQKLQQAIYLVDDATVLDSAFGAVGWFEGCGELETRALGFLTREIEGGRTPERQRAAARALTQFEAAAERLTRIARSHRDLQCRSIALTPLLPGLGLRADLSSCELILAAATLSRDQASGVRAALSNFRTKEAQRAIAQRANDTSTSAAWRLLAVELLAQHESDIAREALVRHGQQGSGESRLRALEVLADRDPLAAATGLRRVVETGTEREALDAITSLAALRDADPAWVEELAAISRSARVATRVAVVHVLHTAHSREALALLHSLLRDDDWRVQVLAVRAVRSYRERESLPKLVAALGTLRRRVADEVLDALRNMTCRDFGRSPSAWNAWWVAEGPTFAVPSLAEAAECEARRAREQPAEVEQRTSTFYGLPIDTDRTVFVIDRSYSMSEPAHGARSASGTSTKLAVAKSELRDLLASLAGDVEFNIVAFATSVESWRPSIEPLDEARRAHALRYVEGLEVSGGTAIYDALEVALDDARADTIYVLTDGEPSGGRVTAIDEIRTLISARAKASMVRIHGVAVGEPSTLLQGLAADTGGQYRFVP